MKRSMALAVGLATFLVLRTARADPPASSAQPPPPPPTVTVTPATPSASASSSSTTPAPEDKEKEDHLVYIGISPFHLFFPIVELQVEARLHRKIGVALIGGYGSVKVDAPTLPQGEIRFKVWELGGQIVGYPVGHFDHGMQLGVEVLYAGVLGDTTVDGVTVSGSANGLSLGPLIGYKFAADIGFSLNIQLGIAYVTARAEAKANNGQQAESTSDSTFAPILNFNLGWSI